MSPPRSGHPVLRGLIAMMFRFIEEHRGHLPANRLCDVVSVSTRGLRAFRNRPASRRQRSDPVTLAHIKELSGVRHNGPNMSDGQVVHTQPPVLPHGECRSGRLSAVQPLLKPV